jgi:hypothetical protein
MSFLWGIIMKHLFTLLICIALAACGGNGGSSSGVASSPTLSGVAATGAAIAGRIYLKDAAGHEQYVDTTDGTYSFSLTNLTAPYMLKAEWTANSTQQKLYSFSSTSGTANITPLTHMVVVAAAGSNTLDAVYAAPTVNAYTAISNALPFATTDLKNSLGPLLTAYSASNFDPITSAFTPNHTGMDALLDNITVSYTSGNVTVADKTSGDIILDAPSNDISHGMTVPAWTAQDAAIANDPDVAVDVNGKGLVVWSETVNAQYVIRARFMTGTGASTVTVSTSGDASLPRVTYDGAGNAIAVWAQFENNRNDIWGSRYVAANHAWTTPVRISDANAVSSSYVPDIGADSSGNAMVVWHQGDGRVNHFDEWSARYIASSNTWTTPVMISDGVNSAANGKVAINAAGQGLAAWVQLQDDGTMISNGPQDIWGRNVTTSGTLGTSVRLNAVAGNVDWTYGQVAVAVHTNGSGGAVWVQGSGILPFVIHAAMYSVAGGWQTSTVITNNALDNSYGPHLAFDSAGNALAVWQQQDGFGASAGANRYVAGTGWGTSQLIADQTLGDVYDPHVAVDGAGNATAVWYQWDYSANVDIRVNRYLVGSGWGTARILTTVSGIGWWSYPVPRVAANAAGQTLAIWGIDSY